MRVRIFVLSAVVAVLFALPAFAQRHRGVAHPSLGLGPQMMGWMAFAVAEDGTVVTTRSVPGAMPMQASRQEVVAITSSGTTSWSRTFDAPAYFVALGNDLALVISAPAGDQIPVETTWRSTIRALSPADGATVWSVPVDGIVMAIGEGPGLIYFLTLQPSTTGTGSTFPGGGMGNGYPGGLGTGAVPGAVYGSRALVAISNAGSLLWSVSLN